MKQLTINDFFDFLDELDLNVEDEQAAPDEETVDDEQPDQAVNSKVTLIETLILDCLKKYKNTGNLPTHDEVNAIMALDEIYRRYQ